MFERIQPREFGKLAAYLRYKPCLLSDGQVAVTREIGLFNKRRKLPESSDKIDELAASIELERIAAIMLQNDRSQNMLFSPVKKRSRLLSPKALYSR